MNMKKKPARSASGRSFSDPSDRVLAALPLSPLDFHLLLVLADGDLYGYGIRKAIEEASAGTLRPEIGSLYRMIGRLMKSGLVDEADERVPEEGEARTPGHPRRYYQITELGRAVLQAEASRLQDVLRTARARKVIG